MKRLKQSWMNINDMDCKFCGKINSLAGLQDFMKQGYKD